MTRYSLEYEDKLVAQISHQQAKYLIDNLPGEWAPYTAKLSKKLVTAYRFTTKRAYRTAGSNAQPPVTIYIREGAYLYPDTDEFA
jgi:hypothetical protein